MVEGRPRRRLTRVIGFRSERVIGKTRIDVPVSAHPIDSINLKDPRLGIYTALSEFVARTGSGKGQLRIVLDPAERHSALTVNEYETLLMKYDLAEVLRNPMRFVAQQYRNVMKDRVGARHRRSAMRSTISSGDEHRPATRCGFAAPLSRPARADACRSVPRGSSVCALSHLLVSEREDGSVGIVEGTYQSPILVQCSRRPARRGSSTSRSRNFAEHHFQPRSHE